MEILNTETIVKQLEDKMDKYILILGHRLRTMTVLLNVKRLMLQSHIGKRCLETVAQQLT